MAAVADIPALVRRLQGGRRLAQLQAARELRPLLECNNPGQAAFMAAGGFKAIVRQLQSSTPALQQEAANLLMSACLNNDKSGDAAAAAGAIPVLLAVLRDCSTSSDGRQMAALTALSAVVQPSAAARAAIMAAHGVPLLAAILQRRERTQLPAAHVLLALARHGPDGAAAVVSSGAIAALVQLMPRDMEYESGDDATAALSSATLTSYLTGLAALCRDSAQQSAAAAEAGVVHAAIGCLRSNNALVQHNSVALLGVLLRACPRLQADVHAAGGRDALQRLLGSGDAAGSDAGVGKHAALVMDALTKAAQQAGAADQPGDAAAADEAPAGAAPPAGLPRVCAAPGCGATHGLRRCGGCRTVRYCSSACSHAHWREHKAECRRRQAEAAVAAEGSAEPAEAVGAA